MNTNLKFIAAAALALGAAATAQAQTAGTWWLKGGINKITPDVKSGNLSAPSLPNTQVDIQSDTQPTFHIGYMYTNNISVELGLGAPYKHDIVGAGSIAGVGKIGDVQALPPTIFGQYRFLEANSQFRPYLGLGLTYAKFTKPRGSAALTALTNPGGPPTRLSVDSKLALTPQMGVTFAINDKWFVDATFSKTFLKTTTKLSTGQSIDATLNPEALGLSIGYKF